MKKERNNFHFFYPSKSNLCSKLPYVCFPFISYQHLQKGLLFTHISGSFFYRPGLDKLTSRQVHSRNNTYDLNNKSHAINNELWIVEVQREVTSLMQHLNPVYNFKWGHLDSVLCLQIGSLLCFRESVGQKGMSMNSFCCFLLSIPCSPAY